MRKYMRIQLVFVGLILFGAAQDTANAAFISMAYTFDGTNMTLTSGPDLFAQNMSVGDTIELTFKADGSASYWDFSNIGTAFSTNLGVAQSGTRGTKGSYEAKLNGATVLNNTFYNVPSQSFVHMGPDYVDWSGVTQLDEFTISYELLSSTSLNNNITTYNNASWDVNQLFRANVLGAIFVHVSDPVPEPASIAMWGLGAISMMFGRRKRHQKKLAA